MKQWRRAGVGSNEIGQLRLSIFKAADLVLELRARHAVQYRLNGFVEVALDALEFALPLDRFGVAIHATAIHLAGELLAELREQFGLHQAGAKAGQDRGF